VRAVFPTREDEKKIHERRAREKAYKETHPCHLYVISKGANIKIGISKRLEQRLEALRVSFPIPIELLLAVQGPYRAIRKAEMEAHKALEETALGGEYFNASRERALDAVRAALDRNGIAAPAPV
jgi:hypothetical protein